MDTKKNKWKNLFIIGGIAALFQIVTVLSMSVVQGFIGTKPASAENYFMIYQNSPLEAFLRGDIWIVILISLYLGTFPALYIVLRKRAPVISLMATLMTLMVVAGVIATDSTFSLLHLGQEYVIATQNERIQLIAAAEAVIASDLWNSTAGYFGGIFLQGAGVLISAVMLKSKNFSKVTAWSGLIGNGLDFIQHVLHYVYPPIMGIVAPIMGIFYFVWYPMLARDFFLLARRGFDEGEEAV
jgi:hypothetical protein